MDYPVQQVLDIAQGPIFRTAFALMVLGILRTFALGASDGIAAYVSSPDKSDFWRKVRYRLQWSLFPSLVIHRRQPFTPGMLAYHLVLCALSLVMRVGAVLVPAFMMAHVYLWERGFGVAWPSWHGRVADILAVITISAGALLFLGRFYSPMLRRMEPVWTFFKPLILIFPFATGYMAMHPLISPFDYHVVMLAHVLGACLVFIMIPFARLLSCLHERVTEIVPEAAWIPTGDSAGASRDDARQPSVT